MKVLCVQHNFLMIIKWHNLFKMDSFKTSLDTWLKHSLKTTKRYEIKNIMIKKIWVKIIAYVFIVHFFFLEILHWIWTSFFSFLMSLKIKKKNHQIYISIDFKLRFLLNDMQFSIEKCAIQKGDFFSFENCKWMIWISLSIWSNENGREKNITKS